MSPLDGSLFGPGQPCFGCAPDHPTGLRLKFEKSDERVITRFTPGEHHQGPPGVMHGGLVTTLADELAAWAIIALKERFGFTGKIECRFHQPARIGKEIVGTAQLARDGSRVVVVSIDLSQDGDTVFSGLFSFVVLDQKGAERMLGGPLPEHWRRFAR